MTNPYDLHDNSVQGHNLPAVNFDAPLVNPSPNGLYGATTFFDSGEGEAVRFLGEGVRVWPHNYGGAGAFGVWLAEWCADPGDNKKDGQRVAPHAPFEPTTVWAYDECDMSPESERDVIERVQQNMRLLEQTAVETEVAARMLVDTGTPATAVGFAKALGVLEGVLAETNTVGYIHASAALAATAAFNQCIIRSGSTLKTPLGNTWVFGGGYVNGLGNTMVATSPTWGWRSTVEVMTTVRTEEHLFMAVAERTVVIGYEAALEAVTIT